MNTASGLVGRIPLTGRWGRLGMQRTDYSIRLPRTPNTGGGASAQLVAEGPATKRRNGG
jgi:hypothetical protein